MIRHIARMAAITLSALVCMFYPFFPGRHDGLAVALSSLAQLLAIAGLLMVPIGVLWLICELRKRTARPRPLSSKDKGYFFAIAVLAASSVVAAVGALVASVTMGFSLGIGVLILWAHCTLRSLPRLRLLKNSDAGVFNPAPLYLIIIPSVLGLVRFTLIKPAVEFSRHRAIMASSDLLNDIEAYHAANGRYPLSLASVNRDYDPSVIGIEQYHYEPGGNVYNVYFEQLTFVLASREIVMYNKLDEHTMASHDGDILLWTPEQLRSRRGYYAVQDASRPHWKYFWFD